MKGLRDSRAARRRSRWRRAAAASLLVASCAIARADGYTLQLNPSYSSNTSTTRDETGHEVHSEGSAVSQKYRLTIDDTLYPNLSLSLGGLLDWDLGTSRSEGLRYDTDSKRWSGFARLRAGTPLLSGTLDYDHIEQDSSVHATGTPRLSSGTVRDSYAGGASWRPSDLPSLDLRLSRTEAHDRAHTAIDLTTDDALAAIRYEPVRDLDLRYSVRNTWTTDHINEVSTTQLANSAAATWGGRYLSGRGTAYASYILGAISSTVSVRGAGGTVSTQQLPVEGLSIVEQFPALPTDVQLKPNSALVDGVTGGSDPAPSAGINLGYSGTSATGERPYRDLGARFANAITPVNAVYVYVDRTVPEELASTFLWTVYRSDDNQLWTPVGAAVPGTFDPLLNRFEIPVERTSAPYLKVVTRPLATNPSTSAQFSEIFVTELQFYLVVKAQEAVGRTSTLSGSLNATTKILLLDAASLTYDLTTLLSHTSASHRLTYSVTNGLSAGHRLGPKVDTSGRLERTDDDGGAGHGATNRWSATMGYNPLPTLGGALVYSGQYGQRSTGTSIAQSLSSSARADLYTGIATSGNVTLGLARNETGRKSRSLTTSAGLTLSPNRVVSMSGSIGYTAAAQTGGGRPDATDRRGLAEVSGSFLPFQALAMSGSVTRIFGGSVPAQTLAAFSAGFSPFQGGDLQLRYGYSETIDVTGEQRTRAHGPSARWNIRRGWFLDGAYSFFDATSPAQEVSSRAFTVNLNGVLR